MNQDRIQQLKAQLSLTSSISGPGLQGIPWRDGTKVSSPRSSRKSFRSPGGAQATPIRLDPGAILTPQRRFRRLKPKGFFGSGRK